MNKEVAVVLVTFNRLELLKKSINSVLSQTTPVKKIFIINNHSTDGTENYLKGYQNDNRFKVINLKENLGGAGGFSAGLKAAYGDGPYDYYWIMDDDTLPEPDALKNLLKVELPAGVLASNVLWRGIRSYFWYVDFLGKRNNTRVNFFSSGYSNTKK